MRHRRLLFILQAVSTAYPFSEFKTFMLKAMNSIDFKNKKVSRFKHPPDGEQLLIREFFQNKPDGFYVDVGANDPVFNSQTWHLEQLGWDGILIEPLPSYCTELTARRKGKVVQSACSSPENHGKTLKLFVAGGHSTLNSTPIA